MKRQLLATFFCMGVALAALAQTEEPIHYKVTAPVGIDLILDGTLTIPAHTTGKIPVLLLIAGSGSTDRDGNSPATIGTFGTLKAASYRMLADSLVRQGIAVARYDKRGSGANIPMAMKVLKPQEHRFDYYVSDAVGFIRQLQADPRFSKVVVAGHSEGSLVGMLATAQTKASGFISLAGAGRNIADILKVQLASLPEAQRQLTYLDLDSLRAGQTVHRPEPMALTILHPLLQPAMISWMSYDPAVELKKVNAPVLIINGKNDLQVAVSEAELLKAARPDAKLILFDQMNHALKNTTADPTDNYKAYTDPSLPLTSGLATSIAQFVKQ